MFFIDGLWLTLLGVLAVPHLIVAKRPDAKQYLDKIRPFQGWIGAVSAIWGVIELLRVWIHTFHFGGVKALLGFVVYTVFVFCMIVLGFILGIGVMKSFIKDPNAQAKMDQTLAKLTPHQGLLGLLALIDGPILLVWTLIG